MIIRRVLSICGLTLACAPEAPKLHAERWPEADRLFTSDSLFIGGDGAYSVDLGGGRVLWLFGDSFIATSPERTRDESWMVRNSVAIQTGYDPTRAFMRFYFRELEGHPSSYLPEEEKYWFWPGHGIRVDDRLLLFWGRVFQEGEGMWGFETAGPTAFLVDNPDDEPIDWNLREASLDPELHDMQLGAAVLRDDSFLYVYADAGDPRSSYLARFELAAAMAGDLSAPSFWDGSSYGSFASREPLVTNVAPEYSVHFAEPLGKYVLTETLGFGSTALGIRTAPRREGPWSEPTTVLRPPESFGTDPFVYAGKAHPELTGVDLAATYVPSAFEDGPADPAEVLYYPRFVRMSYR